MNDLDAALISPPAKNPDVGARAVVTPKRQPLNPKTLIDGSSLVPQITPRSSGVVRQFRYWVGITPSCPVEHIDCAGINFPKVNENLVDDPMRTSQKKRIPVIGAIVFLTEDKIRRLRERLPRTVIRFLSDAGQAEEPGTGKNIGDNHARPRRGQLVTIPTAEEIAQRKRDGKATREYVPHANDVPAARFMFAQLCEDQGKGSRGEFYPEPLEVTGLAWPDDIAEQLLM